MSRSNICQPIGSGSSDWITYTLINIWCVCVRVDCSCGVCYLSFPADCPTCTPSRTDERQRGFISSPHTLRPELFYPTFRCFEMLQTIKKMIWSSTKTHWEEIWSLFKVKTCLLVLVSVVSVFWCMQMKQPPESPGRAEGQRSHVAQSNLTVTSSVWDSRSLEPFALVPICTHSCVCVWFFSRLIILARSQRSIPKQKTQWLQKYVCFPL